ALADGHARADRFEQFHEISFLLARLSHGLRVRQKQWRNRVSGPAVCDRRPRYPVLPHHPNKIQVSSTFVETCCLTRLMNQRKLSLSFPAVLPSMMVNARYRSQSWMVRNKAASRSTLKRPLLWNCCHKA